MSKKFVILGLVLLFTGTALLGWVLTEKKKQQQKASGDELNYDSKAGEFLEQGNEWLKSTPEEPNQLPFTLDVYGKQIEAQLRQEQKERLQADLDELAASETDAKPFADVLYGEDWQNELEKYKKRRELSEFALTCSIVCISMGGSIFAWYLLLWLVRFLIGGMSNLGKSLTGVLRRRRTTKDKKLAKASTEKEEEKQGRERRTNQLQKRLEKNSKVSQHFGKRKSKLNSSEEALLTKSESAHDKQDSKRDRKNFGTLSADDNEKIAVLLSDEKSIDSIARLEDSLKAQTEKLEEKTAESVQAAIIEHSKPLDTTLKDLAQQVSAIREYASCQQERVEKLQDGYDWNIIRTFCLRIIRCIDNLENRISRLSGKGTETEHFQEIKDELIFALESSGIEQYEPEINSTYRGQEKYAEAVKDKEPCDKAKQKGRIAKVIRPGYQYFINEENIKVIRAAQVKLFG
jgi:molecular chaperone GrpE (heat shock protein)